MNHDVDVAIVGGGFGGSLLALVLRRAGLRVALIDRGSHPRFAIGESSTPIANLVLGDLCREYDLSRIAPLTKYGTWQGAYPQIVAGIKRGFSYFHHVAGQPFVTDADHSTELLVAASSSDQSSDTHWLRQDVDAFLFREAETAGAICFEQTDVVELEPSGDGAALMLRSLSRPIDKTSQASGEASAPRFGQDSCSDGQVRDDHTGGLTSLRSPGNVLLRARFVVDGSGEGRFLARRLGIGDKTHELKTQSRTVFAHFGDVTRWQQCLEANEVSVADHPFECDHAALHHVFDGGWMWQLRFNDETVSAGFVQDLSKPQVFAGSPLAGRGPAGDASEEWRLWMDRFPSIAEQYAPSKVVRPKTGLRATGRMQRKLANTVGPWWAMLPNTAGFVDPLHSSGIAHTLCGIERLSRILVRHLGRDDLLTQLRGYEAHVLAEVELIDLLVSGCFAAMGEFRLFGAMSMLYFAAATSYERARIASTGSFAPAFLRADEPGWREVVSRMWDRLQAVLRELEGRTGERRREIIDRFEGELADAVQPFNVVGLCDPALKNMYRHSALPE